MLTDKLKQLQQFCCRERRQRRLKVGPEWQAQMRLYYEAFLLNAR